MPAPIVSDMLSSVPNIKIIVTSREALHVSGETLYDVPSLKVQDEAISLFVQRAQAVKSEFELNDDNSGTVIDICQHLDGMPLAIELAAAQSRYLTPDAILARIGKRFQSFKKWHTRRTP